MSTSPYFGKHYPEATEQIRNYHHYVQALTGFILAHTHTLGVGQNC